MSIDRERQPRPCTRTVSLEDMLECAREDLMGRLGAVPVSMLSRGEVSFVHTILALQYQIAIRREATECPSIRMAADPSEARARAESKRGQAWTMYRLALRRRSRPRPRSRADPVVQLYQDLPAEAWSQASRMQGASVGAA